MADRLTLDPTLVERMRNASSSDVSLTARPQPGILSIRARGDGTRSVARALDVAALAGPNEVISAPLGDVAWVRPDEWLLITELANTSAALAAIQQVLSEYDGAVIDISASRVELELRGARARDVLAAACPLDLHPRAFARGRCAQSLLAKSPIFLQLTSDEPRWRILVRPSLASYVVSWLTDAMAGN